MAEKKKTKPRDPNQVTINARAPGLRKYVHFSEELLASILDRVALGEPLSRICEGDDMPSRKAFFEWVAKDPDIMRRYEFAIQLRADIYAESIITIADEEVTMIKRSKHGQDDGDDEDEMEVVFDPTAVMRNKLRVDARKWYSSKLAPKKYGDKVIHAGDAESPIVTQLVLSSNELLDRIRGEKKD